MSTASKQGFIDFVNSQPTDKRINHTSFQMYAVGEYMLSLSNKDLSEEQAKSFSKVHLGEGLYTFTLKSYSDDGRGVKMSKTLHRILGATSISALGLSVPNYGVLQDIIKNPVVAGE